jgi:hypothetical protein
VSVIASAAFTTRGIPIALTAGDFAQMLTSGAAAAASWAATGTGVGAIVRTQVGAVVGLCAWSLLIGNGTYRRDPLNREIHAPAPGRWPECSKARSSHFARAKGHRGNTTTVTCRVAPTRRK